MSHMTFGGFVTQAIILSLPTTRVQFVSRALHVSFLVDETESAYVFSGFLPFSPPQFFSPFLHTHLIHFVSFHASILLGLHPCYSQIISALDLTLCRTCVEDIIL